MYSRFPERNPPAGIIFLFTTFIKSPSLSPHYVQGISHSTNLTIFSPKSGLRISFFLCTSFSAAIFQPWANNTWVAFQHEKCCRCRLLCARWVGRREPRHRNNFPTGSRGIMPRPANWNLCSENVLLFDPTPAPGKENLISVNWGRRSLTGFHVCLFGVSRNQENVGGRGCVVLRFLCHNR